MTKNISQALNGDDDDESTVLKRVKNAPVPKQRKENVDVEKRVWIRLEENDKIPPTGQFFSLNGRTWYLKPGVPAHVPEALLNVLNDANESVPVIDGDSLKVIDYRQRLRFPYQLVKAPAAAAVA